MIERFTFHIDFGAGEQQVYPAIDDLVFSDEKDSDFGFYRRVVETQLPFLNRGGNNDFDLFYAPELSADCQSYDLEIRYEGQPFYTGIVKYSTGNMAWDLDRCRVDVKLEPKDAYTCLIDGWENEFNILHPDIPRVEVQLTTGTYERFGCEADPGALDYKAYIDDCISGDGWTVILHEAKNNTDPATYRVRTEYARESITLPCSGMTLPQPPGDGWILAVDNCPTDATFVRPVQVVFDAENSFDLGGPTAEPDEIFYQEAYIPVSRAFNGGELTLPNGVLMTSILQQYNPCTDLKVRSNILDLDPAGPNPATAPYTYPRTHHLVVFQKSDIRYPEGVQLATVGTWTYLDVLRYLKAAFDIEPRVLENEGVLQFEHTTYWTKDQGLDLTQSPYLPYIERQNKYTYESVRIPRREKWRYYESTSGEFAGNPVQYNCFAGDDLPEAVTTFERVNADFAFIVANPNRVSDDGFVVMETYVDGLERYLVSRYIYPDTTTLYLNGGLAIGSLIDHFHRWVRPAIIGTMGEGIETFNTKEKRKAQTALSVKLSATGYRDYNADELVRSEIGWGDVKSVRWSAKSCLFTIELLHD